MYGYANVAFTRGDILWLATGGSTIKMALCTDSYTPDQDTHDFFNDVTNEVSASGTGYTSGGATLTLSDPTYDASTNECRLDCDNVTWSSSTITARYAVVYRDTGTASTSPLIGYIDFGENKISSAGNFTVTIAATGLFKITAA